jgi:hypothetical protein
MSKGDFSDRLMALRNRWSQVDRRMPAEPVAPDVYRSAKDIAKELNKAVDHARMLETNKFFDATVKEADAIDKLIEEVSDELEVLEKGGDTARNDASHVLAVLQPLIALNALLVRIITSETPSGKSSNPNTFGGVFGIPEIKGASVEAAAKDIEAFGHYVEALEARAKALVDQIEALEREATTARSNAAASAVNAAAEQERIASISKEVASAKGLQAGLMDEMRAYKEEIKEIIEGASKTGLANSFQVRRVALEKEHVRWTIVFGAGLTCLFLAALLLLGNGMEAMAGRPSASSISPQTASDQNASLVKVGLAPTSGDAVVKPDGSLNTAANSGAVPTKAAEAVPVESLASKIFGYITHVLILAPFLWLTWFAARKLGQLSRMVEDYAFKEATALSFVGYRNEMAQDEEMLSLLRRTAVENFGANPLRVIDHDEPASPAHDALVKVIKKISPDQLLDKLVDLAKALKPGS